MAVTVDVAALLVAARKPKNFSPPGPAGPASVQPASAADDTIVPAETILHTKSNTVHFSRILMACLIFTGGSGLSDLRRSGKLLIFRLTPRLLRRCVRGGKRSWRISLSTASCQASLW